MSFWVTSNKGRREITFPNCWDASKFKPTKDEKPNPVTTGQFQKLVTDWDGEDVIKLFSILSGREYKALEETRDVVLEAQLLVATKFVYETSMDFKEANPPHWVEIGGKQIRIPARIGDLSMGQNMHVRQAIDKGAEPESLISFVVAIYLQPLYDNQKSFDYHRAMELEQEVLKIPISKTYPLAAFFLRKLKQPGSTFLSRVSLKITRLIYLSMQREAT